MNNKRKTDLQALCKLLALEFNRLELLDTALTHTSYANENKKGKAIQHNQRLEFLGDSVLSLVVSTYIYKEFAKKDEGQLTKLRAFLVCEGTLAAMAKEIDLGSYLLLGKGELNMSGEDNPSILADAFESVIGACYLDQGFAAATALLDRLLISKIPRLIEHGFNIDYKTRFQEEVQKNGPVKISYEEVACQGPAHAKTFFMRVIVDGKEYGRGEGHTKKAAEQDAAQMALSEIQKAAD